MTSSRRGSSDARAEHPDVPAPFEPASRLHRPKRALVALVELVLAGLAVWAAFVLWAEGVTVIHMPDGQGGHVDLTHYQGDLLAAASAVGLVAALLVVDAVRQLLLALRARPVRKRGADPDESWPSFDEDN